MFLVNYLRDLYGRFERPISSLSLVAGFVFDIVTLKRVDTWWENLWVFGHIIIVGVFILLLHTKKHTVGDEEDPSKAAFWYVNILQFFFGGILSTYLVFYFRSGDIFVTWPFILLLVGAFWANESLKRHYVRLSFQLSLFFLSIYSFAIFLVPVVVRSINAWVFVLSGLLSLGLIVLFMFLLFHLSKDKFSQGKGMIVPSIAGIFLIFNFLYFTNLIPPIPLSLKDAGVYHNVYKNNEGNYEVRQENHTWWDYFTFYPKFSVISGEPVYIYSAIFSPSGFDLNIVHEWQYYDSAHTRWITDSNINLSVVGGRESGFRTFSLRRNLAPGKWRVNIKTSRGQTMGHVRFNIKKSTYMPALETVVKY